MNQSAFKALLGKPVPAVSVDDLRRGWALLQENSAPGFGIDVRLLEGVCSPGANVLAVFARASLINMLLHQQLLNQWLDDGRPFDKVFEVAAKFPLPKDLQNVNPNNFIAALE